MNRLNERKNEQGSILVEVIAVIALLGVMGPLLFRQVSTRNEEVENINIASEIRTLKEGFAAFILAEKARLLRDMQGDEGCEDIDTLGYRDEIESFLPFGNENTFISDSGDAYYNFYLCKIGDSFLQGYIVPNAAAMPEFVGLKRAARIANLIGADGAICQNGDINGVAGGWGMEDTENWCSHGGSYEGRKNTVYLATTGMDTYMPEVTFEDYSASLVSLPDELALKNLHAWNYFSVGHMNNNCYKLGHNTTGNYDATKGFTANNDEIYDAGENGCDPLFWVGSVNGSDKAKGDVYVKNNLRIGSTTDGKKSAIGLFHADTVVSGTDDTVYDSARSEQNRIEVYDNTGKSRVVINGKGEIIAKSSDATDAGVGETLTLTYQGLESNKKAKDGTAYKVDPAYTSVMNDIKLDSRGGAPLSEILPNYISRAIVAVNSGTATVQVPNCPTGYAPAIIVTPTAWGNSTASADDIASKLQGSVSGSTVSITKKNNSADLSIKNSSLKISIANTEGAYKVNDSSSSWTVKFTDANGTQRSDVKGLAQTYCVYDSNFTKTWSSGKAPSNLERQTTH